MRRVGRRGGVHAVAVTAHTSQQDQQVLPITLRDQIDEEFAEVYCPLGTLLAREGGAATLSNTHADQTAIVGLVRHLHNLECTILALES